MDLQVLSFKIPAATACTMLCNNQHMLKENSNLVMTVWLSLPVAAACTMPLYSSGYTEGSAVAG